MKKLLLILLAGCMTLFLMTGCSSSTANSDSETKNTKDEKLTIYASFEEPEKYNLIVLHKYSRKKSDQPEWISYLSKNLKKGMENGLIREMDPQKV